ncbi:DNA directed RNA polymerase [Penicillium capsulatum]|uniref:DNA directed RNA polymerase n=1 Tax=Penicillium capsulatum TaxID=69766 RepID=A0A9W9ITA1_9EURO|nr:DNA directed RNA polymerase [Penicillium capsulatum]KAJ6129722.1 DNA directed RNA polymerase [Penicillium capsulatum]
MSREAYQVPSMGGGNEGAFGSMAIDSPTVEYICGECSAQVALKRGDPIRCKDCGHRVLYKGRTKRMVQFEAR